MPVADLMRGAFGGAPGATSTKRVDRHQLGTIAFIIGVAGYLFLIMQMGTATPFLVTRGASMEPAYHQGDLLVHSQVAPAEIEVGDVIAFRVPAGESFGISGSAAHRVTGIGAADGQLMFQTQGDNGEPDAFQVPASAVRGVVVKNLGRIGVLFLIFTSRAFLLIGVLPLTLLALAFFGLEAWSKGQKKEQPAPDPAATGRRQELARWAAEARVGIGDLEAPVVEPWLRPSTTSPKPRAPRRWEPALGEPVVEYDAASPPPPSRPPAPDPSRTQAPQ